MSLPPDLSQGHHPDNNLDTGKVMRKLFFTTALLLGGVTALIYGLFF